MTHGGTKKFNFHTRISSRVKYSKTLERGGQLTIRQRYKRYTSIRLINPLDGYDQPIAARPVWLPVFLREEPRMMAIIRETIRRR